MVYSPSHFGDKAPILGDMPFAEDAAVATSATVDKLLLFTTKTCPKCRMAKTFLEKAGIEYETVLADENAELVNLYGVKEAPTLVILADDGSFEKVSNPSNIKAFCDKSVNA